MGNAGKSRVFSWAFRWQTYLEMDDVPVPYWDDDPPWRPWFGHHLSARSASEVKSMVDEEFCRKTEPWRGELNDIICWYLLYDTWWLIPFTKWLTSLVFVGSNVCFGGESEQNHIPSLGRTWAVWHLMCGSLWFYIWYDINIYIYIYLEYIWYYILTFLKRKSENVVCILSWTLPHAASTCQDSVYDPAS